MATLAPYDLGEWVVAAAFVADEPVFALADGRVEWPVTAGSVAAHDGLAGAALALDRTHLVTGGEDGRVCRVDADGARVLIEEEGGWFDAVAAGPDGAAAAVTGRTVLALERDGAQVRRFDHARAVEGVAFAPKGKRIAAARYDGVSLHWLNGTAKPVELEWAGPHTGVSFSPDGRYVMTTMAENALHGWRVDGKAAGGKAAGGKAAKGKGGDTGHLRMSGYPAKPKSLSWSARGRWLASDGAPAAILWPFTGKEGPQGKAPKELGARGDSMVVALACHPSEEVVAIGYRDGMVLAVRIEDAAETLLRRPAGAPVTVLAWDREGHRLAFGTEAGEAGLIDVREG